MRRISGSTRAVAEQRVVDVVEVGRLELAVGLALRLLVGVAEDDELELGAGERGPAALLEARELRAQDLPRRGDDVRAVVPDDVGQAQRGRLLPGHAPQRRRGRGASRSRRSRAPMRPSRSRRRCSCRRRRRAGSCSPRRRARRPRRGRSCATSRLPGRRPCMSVIASSTVSIVPSSTSSLSSSSRIAVEGTAPEPFAAASAIVRARTHRADRRRAHGAAARAPAAGKDRDHRRRRRRRVDRLPPRRARRARRRAARPRRADQRLDVPLGRARRAAARAASR